MSSAFIWTHFHSSLPPESSVQSPVSGEGGRDSLCIYFSPFQIHTMSTVCTWDPFGISKVRSQASSLLEVLIFFFFHDAAEVGASYAHFLKFFFLIINEFYERLL